MEYEAKVDISELIKHNEVMDVHGLGPNGALVYCIEFLEANVGWLITKVLNLRDHYIIFDCPGQVKTNTSKAPTVWIGRTNLAKSCFTIYR